MKFFFEVIGLVIFLFVAGVFLYVDDYPKREYNQLEKYKTGIIIEKQDNWLNDNYIILFYKDSTIRLSLYDVEFIKCELGDTIK